MPLHGQVSHALRSAKRDRSDTWHRIQDDDSGHVERGVNKRNRQRIDRTRGERSEQRSDGRADVGAECHGEDVAQGHDACGGKRHHDRGCDARGLDGDRDDKSDEHRHCSTTASQNGVERSFHPVRNELFHVAGDEGERGEHHEQPEEHHRRAEEVLLEPEISEQILAPAHRLFHPLFDRAFPLAAGRPTEGFGDRLGDR